MKNAIYSLLIVALAVFTFQSNTNIEGLEIGAKAPLTDLQMTSVDQTVLSLQDVVDENGLLVIFSCNTCPFVIAWEHRYNELFALCSENQIGMIVVNSNEAKRDGDDSMDEMIMHAKENNYQFAYVEDTDHKLADAFGATKTPDVFLFRDDWSLGYKGAIDNSGGRGEMTEDYLGLAINNMVAKKDINPNSTKAIGCSIKRIK